jgi:hypothetical protein
VRVVVVLHLGMVDHTIDLQLSNASLTMLVLMLSMSQAGYLEGLQLAQL